jgi:hypothetical protein
VYDVRSNGTDVAPARAGERALTVRAADHTVAAEHHKQRQQAQPGFAIHKGYFRSLLGDVNPGSVGGEPEIHAGVRQITNSRPLLSLRECRASRMRCYSRKPDTRWAPIICQSLPSRRD